MAFQQGLSGLNSSSKAIDAISNNIANASTVGFKSSQAHFADVYAASLQGAGASQVGIGVGISNVFQQFTQGNITTTNNALDISISGGGFYRMSDEGAVSYSRNGQFHLDKDGFIVNDQDLRLTGFLPDPTSGVVSPSTPGELFVDPSDIQPRATGAGTGNVTPGVVANLNFDSRADFLGGWPAPTVSPGPLGVVTISPLTYNFSTAQTVYDTLGNPHNLTYYVVKTANPGQWEVHATVDGTREANVDFNAPASAAQTAAANATAAAAGTAAANSPATLLTATNDATVAAGGNAIIGAAAATAAVDAFVNALSTGSTLAAANTAAQTAADAAAIAAGAPPAVPPPAITAAATAAAAAVNTAASAAVADVTAAAGGGVPLVLEFDNFGKLITPATTPSMSINLTGVVADLRANDPSVPNNAAAATIDFPIDFSGTTQFGSAFGVNSLTQDGYSSGRLAGISVAADGIVQGRYTNGQTRELGQVVLANFRNPNGLQPLGNNLWAETSESGGPLVGAPGSASLGVLQSSAVEESNVDMTNELVAMITAQRNYQANAQSIKTQDQIMNTLVNLR